MKTKKNGIKKRDTEEPPTLLQTALVQATTRVLGMNTLPITITDAMRLFVQHYAGRAEEIRELDLGEPLRGIFLKGVDMGCGVKTSVYVVGFNSLPNTAIIREDWWKARVLDNPGNIREVLTATLGADASKLVGSAIEIGQSVARKLVGMVRLP